MGFKFDPLKGELIYTSSTGGGSGAVDSVNSRTGAVVLTSLDVGLENVDNTSDADKPISTATQTALDDKAESYVVWNAVFVDKNGNDSTALVGREDRPCLTIAKALTLVSGASLANRWVIMLGAGSFIEATLAILPHVWISGPILSNISGGLTRLAVTSGSITYAAGWSAASLRGGLVNIYLNGGTGLNLDRQALSASGSGVFELNNVGITGNTIFKSNTATADFLDCIGIRSFGSFTISGGSISISRSDIYNNITLNNSGLQNIDGDIYYSYIAGDLNINQSGSDTIALRLEDTRIDGTRNETGTPTVTTPLSNYKPTTLLDWNLDPASVNVGLDELASRVKVLEGSNSVASSVSFELLNDTGSTLPDLSPLFINNFGNLEPIDIATIPNNVSVCVLPTALLDSEYGSVVFKGRILDITTSLNIGDVVYLDKSGAFSSSIPAVGVGGVVEGDAYIKIGVISANQDVPTDKDLIVDAFIVTRL